MNSAPLPLHILFICSGLNAVGGLERIVTNLANQLAEVKYEVSILVIDKTTKSYYPLHEAVNVVSLEANFGTNSKQNYIKRKLSFLQDILDFKKVVSDIAPRIIISTDYVFTTVLFASRVYKRYKCICWQHGIFDCPKSRVWRILSKLSYRKIHAIAAMNGSEYELYKKYNNNTFIIPNFIDPSTVRSSLENKTILSVAALANYKGIDLLVKTAIEVLKKHPDWIWKLIGKGELENYVLKQIQQNKLQDRLILQTPHSHQITNEYLNAAFYVMTSRIELFGMVLIEAMNHGLPCIAFDCPSGPRHIITDNKDGFLIEPENTAAMATAISLLIENEGKRKKLGANALQNVSRFYSDAVVKEWVALFKRL